MPLVGIGDDCAVIPADHGMAWLVTTDALVEGIHFLKEQISAKDLGYKTIAVSVSDVAAMGGEPKYAFLSIALPKTIEAAWASDLIFGIKEACEKWDLLLLGGDTVGSLRDLFLNVTLIGSAKEERIVYRHGARVGDLICASGTLGDSGGGLKMLQEKIPVSRENAKLIRAHFHPEPSPKQGIWLASQQGVHAMMDISDGLDCDLQRLLRCSHTGALIEIDRFPLSSSLIRICAEQGWDPIELALTGGEDYCLLLSVDPKHAALIQSSFQELFGSPLHVIGSVTAPPSSIVYLKQGKAIEIKCKHFDHFQE